jgi:hypothetical protein
MTVIDKAWDLQHKIENKFKNKSKKKLNLFLSSNDEKLLFSVMIFVLTFVFLYKLEISNSLGTKDDLRFIWLIGFFTFLIGSICIIIIYLWQRNVKG